MTYAPSDFDKRRMENIKRNNQMLRQLGLETVPEDANVKLKQSKKMKKTRTAAAAVKKEVAVTMMVAVTMVAVVMSAKWTPKTLKKENLLRL